MKKRLVVAGAVCLTALVGVGLAQMEDIVRVTLPHAALVGAVTLPAGEYTIRDLANEGSASPVLQIRSASGANVTAMAVRISGPDSRTSDRTHIVLRRDGDKYDLDKIWFGGRDYGYELAPFNNRER